MSKNVILVLAFLLLVVGCATGVVVKDQLVPYVYAQDGDQHQYKQCTIILMNYREMKHQKHFNAGEQLGAESMVQIPPGWTPMGGTGSGAHPGIVICR